jgi:(p)ppGpp synthase/HD superfamily hydrolase
MSHYNPVQSAGLLLGRRFDLALQFASALHQTQLRKGTKIPYIAHLLSVCALVLEQGGNEDQAIAALLHDAVEDQGGLPTLTMIERLFGLRVTGIVRECSDSESADPAHKLPWQQRKQAYLDHLQQASADALLISAADKLHNTRDILSCYRQIGDELWKRFNPNATKADHLWYYRELVRRLQARPEAPKQLVDELDRVVIELEGLARLEELGTL